MTGFIKSEAPMHVRRSLDQFGYPALRDTTLRDNDQVLYKYTSKDTAQTKSAAKVQPKSTSRSGPPPTVLMVDTIWLWILADDIVLSFVPRREAANEGNEELDETEEVALHADPVKAVMRSLADQNAVVKDSFDLTALVVLHCVDALLRGSTESSLKVLRVFEGYASEKIEEQTTAYKNFRKQVNGKLEDWKIFQTTKGVGAPRINEGQETDIGKDLFNLLELQDILDELKTLRKLLKLQSDQVCSKSEKYKMLERFNKGAYGREILKEAKRRIEVYTKQIEELSDSTTESVERYKSLLELKEAHSAVQEARVTSEQARVVNIFTIITIIFSPLSFFAGIFGMVSACLLFVDPPFLPSNMTDQERTSPIGPVQTQLQASTSR